MSLTRSLLKSLRSPVVLLAFIAVSIALQNDISAQALQFEPSREAEALFDILPLQKNTWNDGTADFGEIIRAQGFNQSKFDIMPWHPRTIEYDELIKVTALQEGRLEVVRHPVLGTKPALVKRAALPEYIESISLETTFYRLLDGLGVTPTFLGHVREGGRITGFIAEYVEQDQEAGNRPGRDGGTEACLSALRRMHARGIAHRDAHGGNCLVRSDGSAVIVDFELAEEASSEAEFERDLWVMRHSRVVEGAA